MRGVAGRPLGRPVVGCAARVRQAGPQYTVRGSVAVKDFPQCRQACAVMAARSSARIRTARPFRFREKGGSRGAPEYVHPLPFYRGGHNRPADMASTDSSTLRKAWFRKRLCAACLVQLSFRGLNGQGRGVSVYCSAVAILEPFLVVSAQSGCAFVLSSGVLPLVRLCL